MQADELARLPLFSGLKIDQLERLGPLVKLARFAAGETIFAAGAPANRLYVVIAGEVSLRYRPDDGGSVDIAKIGPGGAFGWSAVLRRAQYTSSAICLADVEALTIHSHDLFRVMSEDVALRETLSESLGQLAANRQRGLGQQVIQLLQSDDRS